MMMMVVVAAVVTSPRFARLAAKDLRCLLPRWYRKKQSSSRQEGAALIHAQHSRLCPPARHRLRTPKRLAVWSQGELLFHPSILSTIIHHRTHHPFSYVIGPHLEHEQ